MINLCKKIFLLMLFCIMPMMAVYADVLKGRVVNAETGEAIAGASVAGMVRPKPEWTYNVATETDSLGQFHLSAPMEGRIVVSFSMIGYKVTRKVDYAYGPEVKDTTDIGEIRLQPTALMLKELEVTAHIPRFTMAGDTIVFNPQAFKLKEGARLDELIKKLPGVQNKDGKLYWNDKPIRLMMNGKDLFGGSAIMGQLPAEVASKMKLYDRKSELARHTGKDEGEEDNVLDIQVKPGFLDKWYGEIEAGYITDDRYAGNITANRLSDHDPQMVYAQANRANRYIDRSMYSGMDRNIAGDGKSQYGSYNYQHNWKKKDAKSTNYFNVSANMGHSDGVNRGSMSSETFFPNSERTYSVSKDNDFKHMLTPQVEAKLKMYVNPKNLVNISAKTVYEKSRENSESRAAMYGYEPGNFVYHPFEAAMAAKPGDELYKHLITRNHRYDMSETETKKLNTTYSWTHFLGKKGSFEMKGKTSVADKNNEQNTKRSLEYIREGNSETVMQYFNAPANDVSTSLEASFNYWLGEKVYLSASDEVEYNHNRKDRNVLSDTYGFAASDGVPTSVDQSNAMHGLLHKFDNSMQIKLTINPSKQFMLMPKVDWTARREKQDYRYGSLDTTAVRISHIVQPSLLMRWKISRERIMDMKMAYYTNVPDMESTMGYTNTLDPMYIYEGNPNLEKSHTFTAKYSYRRLWLRKQIVLGVSAFYKKESNPITNMYRYNTLNGVYTSKPVNVKDGDMYELEVNYDHGLGAFFRVTNQIGVFSQNSYGYMTIVDGDKTPGLNHERKSGVNDEFEFSYEIEKLQIKAYNRLNWIKYRYSENSYNSATTTDRFGVSVDWDLNPVRLYLDVADVFRSGYSVSDMNKHRLMCEASASYSFCKNKCHLTLSADDIFNKDDGYWANYTAYQRTISDDYNFHHYLKLSFRYQFDAKSKK